MSTSLAPKQTSRKMEDVEFWSFSNDPYCHQYLEYSDVKFYDQQVWQAAFLQTTKDDDGNEYGKDYCWTSTDGVVWTKDF